MRSIIMVCLIAGSSLIAQAQLQERALTFNPILKKAAVEKQSTRQMATDRSRKGAALPFFDDFSYAGPYPDANYWMNDQVFVNTTLANQPVSIGVATFDGLDASGSPYGGAGWADTLTSIPLDLSGNVSKFMSYYIQPKGLGDAPGPEDKLILEFKNKAGEWVEVQSHEVTLEERFFPRDSLPSFTFIGPIEISEQQFLHEDFQFRFRNFALRNGAVDMWHLDYIRVDKAQTLQNLNDLAFTQLPSSVLTLYSSAPWRHLQDVQILGPELRRNRALHLYNHAANTLTTTDSKLRIINFTEGVDDEKLRLTLLEAAKNQTEIPPGRHLFEHEIVFNYADRIINIVEGDRVVFKTQYEFMPNEEAIMPELDRNNTVTRFTVLDDFYAYDDGSAESALFVGTGGQVAVRFTNYQEDLLQAVQVQIPRIVSDISNSNFTLKVWLNDLGSEPVYEAPFTNPLFIDEFRDSLQAFTTYVLRDAITGENTPIRLPVGDFYIGWQQVTSCSNVSCIPFGFDRNTPSATQHIFVNTEGNWEQIGDFFQPIPSYLQGALMIRPIVGSDPPKGSESVVSIEEVPTHQLMDIFPNPTNGKVHFQLYEGKFEDYQLVIFNAIGQKIQHQTLRSEIEIPQRIPGIYFLQFVNKKTQVISHYKLIVRN